MADNERLICNSDAIVNQGVGVRFAIPELGDRQTGFVVRYQDTPRAFVNRCAHVPIELDWNEGDFFDVSKTYLICSTHGAHYAPTSGYCVLGPCKGKRLMPLQVSERDGQIFLLLDSLK